MFMGNQIPCVWEHRGEDTILWPVDYPGAFARGACLSEALAKIPGELLDWSDWTGQCVPEEPEPEAAPDDDTSVWEELDAAYQEGVDSV
jgi:hypothetical protein